MLESVAVSPLFLSSWLDMFSVVLFTKYCNFSLKTELLFLQIMLIAQILLGFVFGIEVSFVYFKVTYIHI